MEGFAHILNELGLVMKRLQFENDLMRQALALPDGLPVEFVLRSRANANQVRE